MSAFVDSLHEVFERFGRIEARRLFGGHGLYREGRMFALVAAGQLYLKTDAQSLAAFTQRDLAAFVFSKNGKPMSTSYRAAPAEVFEDRDEAAQWAQRAWQAALRSGSGQPVKTNTDTKAATRRPRAPAQPKPAKQAQPT